MIVRQRNSFGSFDFGMQYNKSPFWRAYDEVCEAFDLSSRRAIAWTNISKVQLRNRTDDGSVSIEKLPPEARMEGDPLAKNDGACRA